MRIPDFRRFEVYAQFLKVRHKTERRLISFHPENWYPAQKALHQTIEAIRSRGQPVWILLLKARQEGCCLDPSTLVLTADLKWTPIARVKPGDELVGFDEFPVQIGKKRDRQLKRTAVVAVARRFLPAFRIVTEEGEIIATADHRFLVYRSDYSLEWCTVARMVRRLSMAPWKGVRIRWFGDFFNVASEGGQWEGRAFSHSGHLPDCCGFKTWGKVKCIEPLGKRLVIDLQTTTGTFIANGFASHNSTFTTARIFHATATQRNTNSLILADKKDRAEYIFEMCKTFYDHLPDVLKPTRKYSNKKELIFDTRDGHGLKSGIYIATALDQFTGQGMTLHNVHVSEASSFPYLGLVFTTLLPAIPPTSDTMVIVETTAKGAGTEFHEEWQKAKAGQSVFVPVFFPWFIHPEYRKKPPEEELRRGKLILTEEERRLVRQFHLDDEQIYWRRHMIEQVYRGDEESFAQEFPATDEEAFIVAGNCYFDKARLKEALVNCRDPVKQLEVDAALRGPYDLVYRLREHDRGRLWVWHEPQKGHRYRLGVDVAEGKGQNYSAIEVFDETTMEQVAEWMDNTVDPISFARTIVAIAKWYNEATVAIEINGPGLATQNEAKRFYYNFYFHQYIDRFTNRRTDKLGWLTTPTFKRYLLSYMEHVIDHGVWKFNSSRLVGQLMTFVHSGDLAEAAPGCFDDLVMAAMIALYTAYQDGTIFWDKQDTGGERIIDQKRDILDLSPPPDYDSWWEEKEQEEHWLAL